MSAFFAMGGYGAYIWPAYGVSVLLLGAAIVMTWRAYAKARAQLAALEKP
jgi:heme exporter protein D